MGRVAVFVDAGYFWVQAVHIVVGAKGPREQVSVNFPSLRSEFLDEISAQFPKDDLLRIYWYDGPASHGKADSHRSIESLDDFKLRLGTRNGAGDQKAVDGLIIADLIGLAQNKSISNAIIVSGDADLTPGVQAAQGLGIRVHLLSMGPTNATSPYLKAEVDQKKSWDDTTVKKFASLRIITAAPPAAATSTVTTAPTPTAAIAAPISAGTSSGPDPLDTAAATFLASLNAAERALLPKGRSSIPSELDKRLLTTARHALSRSLTDTETRSLRAKLRALV